jgi:hypothetical protein
MLPAVYTRPLVTFVVMLALSSCVSESATSPPDPVPIAFELMTQTGSFHAGQHALDAAEQRLTGECMTKKGFFYTIETHPVDTRTDEERAIDLDSRRLSGYGLHDSWASSQSTKGTDRGADFPSQTDRHVAQLPENKRAVYMRALFGEEDEYSAIRLPDGSTTSFPTRGCAAEARVASFGDVALWARVAYVPQTFNNILTKRVFDDRDYAATMTEWRACMAAKGYQFASPADAAEKVDADYRQAGYTPAGRAYEIAVAVADGECARDVRVPSRVLDLKRKYLLALPDNDRQALGTVAEAWFHAVEMEKRT